MHWLVDTWNQFQNNIIASIAATLIVSAVGWSLRRVHRSAKDFMAGFAYLEKLAECSVETLRTLQTREDKRDYIRMLELTIVQLRDWQGSFTWKLVCVAIACYFSSKLPNPIAAFVATAAVLIFG